LPKFEKYVPIFQPQQLSDRINPHEIPEGEALAMRYDPANPPRADWIHVFFSAMQNAKRELPAGFH
jgi:hypothetical protein